MDNYLENLVKKTTFEGSVSNADIAADDVVDSSVNEVADGVVESGEADVKEDTTPDLTVKPPKPDKKEYVQPIIIEINDSDPSESKPKTENKAETTKVNSSKLKFGRAYSIQSAKVYKTPRADQPCQLISGKVVYTRNINGFAEIEYMKNGFGIVRGYVKDLESYI